MFNKYKSGVLKKYGITFYIKGGRYAFEANEGILKGLLFLYVNKSGAAKEFLRDVNLTLEGRFNELEETDRGGDFAGIYISADITEEKTLLLYYDSDISTMKEIPLTDIKEILESLIDFI